LERVAVRATSAVRGEVTKLVGELAIERSSLRGGRRRIGAHQDRGRNRIKLVSGHAQHKARICARAGRVAQARACIELLAASFDGWPSSAIHALVTEAEAFLGNRSAPGVFVQKEDRQADPIMI
jgi:hypothetical protein